MPRTRQELEKAAVEAEERLESFEQEAAPGRDVSDLRRVGRALRAVADAEGELAAAVAAARRHGRSWAAIGTVLGISRQAARERFKSV